MSSREIKESISEIRGHIVDLLDTLDDQMADHRLDEIVENDGTLRSANLGQLPEHCVEDALIWPTLETLGFEYTPRPYYPVGDDDEQPDFSIDNLSETVIGENKSVNRFGAARDDIESYLDTRRYEYGIATDGLRWGMYAIETDGNGRAELVDVIEEQEFDTDRPAHRSRPWTRELQQGTPVRGNSSPEMAIELRNWLVTVAQRLGYEPATVAEIRTPPTTTAPETIAPVVGDIAVVLDGAFLADPETVRIRLERDVEPMAEIDPPASSPYRPAVLDDRDTAGAADTAGEPAYELGGHADADPRGDVPDIDAVGPPEADPRSDTTPHNISLPEEVWQHVPTRPDTP